MVSIFYRLLVRLSNQFFPWKSIWKQKVPSRVAFFGNYYLKEKSDNWQFKGGKKACNNMDWCYICKCNSESIDNLFLHCPIATGLWAMILGLLEHIRLCQSLLLNFLLVGKGSLVAIVIDIYGLLFPIVLCCILKGWNSRCFKDNENSLPDLKLLFF